MMFPVDQKTPSSSIPKKTGMIPVLPLPFACSSRNRPLRVPAYPDAVTGAPFTAYRSSLIRHLRSSVPLRNHLQLFCLHPSQPPGILCKRFIQLTLFFIAFAFCSYKRSVTRPKPFVKSADFSSLIRLKIFSFLSNFDTLFLLKFTL